MTNNPYLLASRQNHPADTLVTINNNTVFGGVTPVIIAGPCAIESYEQFFSIAQAVQQSGAHMLRGGAFKPRTSPYSFQGLKAEGLKIMYQVKQELHLPIVSEVLAVADLPLFERYVDMIQIGARNMHNFDLLEQVADTGKPILLKRGWAATMAEFLLAAEYILRRGNAQVVLCERGIRTFETSTRNVLDLNTLVVIKQESHLPIIADPSHAAGRADVVLPLSKAAIAAGAHGLMVEVHAQPEEALCDGQQSLNLEQFTNLIHTL